MRCIVTAGPTYEPLDKVRRLTNFSSGRLGAELATWLADKGHQVLLLIGQQATWPGRLQVPAAETFTTTSDLRAHLRAQTNQRVHAVFHAAAVSDFAFGQIHRRLEDGTLQPVQAGKIPTSEGVLFVELVPTAKIIAELRDWFAEALLVGWKYEVDGDRSAVLQKARRQIEQCRTNACVANGPAFGKGFGLLRSDGRCDQCDTPTQLFETLTQLLDTHPRESD